MGSTKNRVVKNTMKCLEKMKVLVLSGFGIESTYPNPICMRKIIEKLSEYPEIQIDVACNAVVENTPVLNWKRNPSYMLRRIKCWPSYNPDVEQACRRELFSILSEKTYDCIFVPHKPFETVYAACKAKEKYPDIKLCIYALDPIANEIDANNGIGKYLFFLTKKAEEKVFMTADHIFHMECNRKKYASEKYKKYADKFSYLDFPLIEEQHMNKNQNYSPTSNDEVVMLYSGALDDTYRPSKYLLDLFDAASEKLENVSLHFYAKGNSVAEIERRCEHNKAIESFGYIPKRELEKRVEEAQFLINIGNKFSDMLPSKLLTYFMGGRPIIHVKNQENDSCISYLERYGLFLIIDEKDSLEKSVEKFVSFVKSNQNKKVPSEHIIKVFRKNTPEWNAEQIKKVLMGEIKNVN